MVVLGERKSFLSTLNLYGLPWHLFFLFFVVIVFTAAWHGTLSTDMAGTLALCIAIAGVFDEIGERLPIWNSYIGGGLLMVFFGTAVLRYFGVIPPKYLESVSNFISGNTGFLTFFIIFLVTGSILSLDRHILLRSFLGYLPAILGGLVAAFLLAIAAGSFFGIGMKDIAIKYVLPIMGGGNGAGAVPLSQIYEQATGEPAASYYGFAVIVLTLANVMCIFAAALLNKLGEVFPALTGDKKNLLRGSSGEVKEETKVSYSIKDLGGAMLVTLGSYVFGRMCAKIILPSIFGTSIHQLACMILFVVVLAMLGVVPKNICAAAKRLQSFMTGTCAVIIMVGMGVDFDLMDLVRAGSLQNLIIALSVVIGAILGSAVVGWMVGFYPIDSAITAGLCMANRGGNGDLAVLGAADRMELMAYAQLSSRLGGGIVLIIASFVFSSLRG
ncbi:MAG: 2-hydroxycarboxylate transporter family protein [Synergistaceae bacterium]|jgi:Na+/citrate or Na+/malate symporter|nr:2-hydroxycarboxylate transporter family protein [Synergistaceae bacterium]